MRIIDKSKETLVFFPKNINNLSKTHNLYLHSELTNETYKLNNLIDNGNLSDYYKFICDFENIPNGEYKYTIDNEACGLIILGNVNSTINNIEYIGVDNNKYIVYNDD